MKKSAKSERKIDVGYVEWQPVFGGPNPITLVVRLDKLGRLVRRAENSVRGRAKAANGVIEVRLERTHPLAGEGSLAGGPFFYNG